jgi:hypothetical protein
MAELQLPKLATWVRFPSPAPDKNFCRGVEQLVARRAHNPEVAGSNPAPATTIYAHVAQ